MEQFIYFFLSFFPSKQRHEKNSYPRVGDEYYIGVRAMCQGTRSKMSRSFRWKRDGCKFGTEARQLRPHRIVGPGRNQRSNLPPLATLQGALDPDNSSNIVLQFAPPPKKLDRASRNSSADILPLFSPNWEVTRGFVVLVNFSKRGMQWPFSPNNRHGEENSFLV